MGHIILLQISVISGLDCLIPRQDCDMADTEESIQQEYSKSKIPWKLLPECLRRKSDRSFAKSKKPEETVSVGAGVLSPVSPSSGDRSYKKDETEFETNEAKNIEKNTSQYSKKKLKCRKSLTYGQCYNCDRVKHTTTATDMDDISLERKTRHSLHRPLSREKSCYRRDNPEFLTKNEARKRLLSWQKTTIVRKNSEQQQYYSY